MRGGRASLMPPLVVARPRIELTTSPVLYRCTPVLLARLHGQGGVVVVAANDAAPTRWRIPMARLTDTQLIILSAASQRDDRGVELPANLKGEAARKAVAKLIRAGLLEEVRAGGALPVWRRDDESGSMALLHHQERPRSDRCRG